ncbi:MAG: hypothetical protein FJZ04_01785 [Candidatus Moranbacteria bacterium]|nr:hypothetical protein [Candidatus Moranbacteria bacterium]
MRLEDLRQKLYSRGSDIVSRKPQTNIYDPRSKKEESLGSESPDQPEKEAIIETGTTQKQKTLLLLAASAIFGVILFGGGGYLLYKLLKKDFRSEQVQIKVNVPPAVNLNENVEVEVLCANNNPVVLKDAHLTLETPSNFISSTESANPPADTFSKSTVEWNLGNFNPQENKSFKFYGRFTSREEDSVSFKAFLRYTPSNFNSQFQNDASVSTRVIGIPITLSVEATREAASGFAISYQIKVRNEGSDPLQSLSMKMAYPLGFGFINSSIPLAGDRKDIWEIPTLLSNEEKVLSIEGKIEGQKGEKKIFSAHLGKNEQDGFKEYIVKEAFTDITEPPILVTQEVQNDQTTVHKNDELNLIVKFTNKSDRAIRNAIVKVKIEGAIFDQKSILIEKNGSYDGNTKEVVWQGGNTPEVALINPGSSGELRFRIKIADYIPFSGQKSSNFTGSTVVSLESPEIPTPIGSNKIITGNTLNFKLSTFAGIKSAGYYNDSAIPNSGPLPPTVDKETSYTIHWTVTNAFNDLRNIEVKSVLPYGLKWMNKVYPSKTGLVYNENTREITWNLERIPAGAGIDKAASSLAFQVSVTPTDDQYGKIIDLMGQTTLRATDTFTQETIVGESPKIDSTLPDDKSMIESLSRVIRPGDEF